MTGNGLSQVIALLLTPVVARFFTPAEIGVYAFLLSIVVVFSNIASGRYEQAIVVAEDEKEAINLFALGLIILSVFNVFILLVVIVLLFTNFSFFEGSISELWALTIPVFGLIYSFYLLLRFYSIRMKKFKNISASKPSESLTRGSLNIAFGWIFGGAWGLIIAGFASKVVSLLVVLHGAIMTIKENSIYINRKVIKYLAKKYFKFPLYDAPNSLIYSIGQQGIMVFLARLYTEAVVGIYSYTNRILLTPVLFFSTSFSQVMYQKLSVLKNKDKEQFHRLVVRSTNNVFYYSVIPFLIFVFAAKFYVPLLFGDAWVDLYKYMYVMAPYSLMVLMSAAFTNVFKIDDKQEYALVLKIVFVVSRVLIIVLGASLGWGILKTLLIFSVVSVISALMNYIVYFSLHSRKLPHCLISFVLIAIIVYGYVMNEFNIVLL